MKSRSLVHLLHVFAARLESDGAPKATIDAIKLFATDRTIRRAEHRDGHDDEERRIDRQRNLFVCLPCGDAAGRLKAAMLQRAYDLLWDGDALGCDALIEFLPSSDVEQMMTCWSDDFEGSEPRSRFHRSEAA